MKHGQIIPLRESCGDTPCGAILISVENAVVRLDGWVISLSHKRIAGAMAWLDPGCRDVANALEVAPPEQDGDNEIVEALSLVLEMDPMIPDSGQIRVRSINREVSLDGAVSSMAEKQRAEQDAWSLFGVDNVKNHLSVASQGSL